VPKLASMGWRGAIVVAATLLGLAAPAVSRALPASAPDPAVTVWQAWPFEGSCYSRFDPVQVFRGPATAELGSAPAQIALREITASQSFPPLPQHRWRRVTETESEAVFAHGQLSSPFGPLWVSLKQESGNWKWNGSGTCTPRTTLHELEAVTWTLDAEQLPLGPNTRRLLVDLGPGPCSSGMSQNERARKPIFRQFGKRLVMIILLEPLPPGIYTCQGIIEPPLKVKLPMRLGSRKLFDGGAFPPKPPVLAGRGSQR
jgi:hypothetical protein